MLSVSELVTALSAFALVSEAALFTTAADQNGNSSQAVTSSPGAASVLDISSHAASINNSISDGSTFGNRTDLTTSNSTTAITKLAPVSTTTEADYDYTNLWQYKDGVAILTYAPPFLLVLATVGNTISVIVLQSPVFRGSSTSFLLSALAMVDAIIVNTGLMRQWVSFAFNIDVRDFSSFGCKLHIFIVYCFQMVSFFIDSVKWKFHLRLIVSRAYTLSTKLIYMVDSCSLQRFGADLRSNSIRSIWSGFVVQQVVQQVHTKSNEWSLNCRPCNSLYNKSTTNSHLSTNPKACCTTNSQQIEQVEFEL
jgi:hypothetical protein